MKRSLVGALIIILISGCGHSHTALDQALQLRETILAASAISFCADITADYGDEIYTFQMECSEKALGKMDFTITSPETIAGITGTVSQNQPAFTFDDKVLAFPPLVDSQVTPVIAPYVLLQTLRGGYISACSREGDGYCIYLNDSYREDQLYVQVYTNMDFIPIHAEIVYHDQRILSLDISKFLVL